MTIKKGDQIRVIAGREKGKQGTVERVIRDNGRVVVNGINVRKHHLKPSRSKPQGGIIEVPAAFSRANVMIICPHCSRPTRVSHTVAESGDKFRSCSHCHDSLEVK
ncbi:50S ribosomal protein L24 [Patescibacteria group bacterium]|nr:50S ribosomal protein L24 [Patescibacteria group bacterium]